ncbi:peptidoglycan-binding domain-containing protein [Mastigocladopsis repens]|uniref:peptidoglycan-binding domain-containing protein n=1 Tax=Mastigocladopsis repens TaxID=221287 RepID=UPI0002E924F7|nr:peptidoglycan-binding protein [Mastigocladopsis repens]
MPSTSDARDTREETVQIQSSKAVLRQGSKGKAVEELQNLLSYWGIYTGPINGEFEPQTEQAVKEFQRRVFLQEDGIVGERTWRVLATGAPVDMPELSKGCNGELVRKVQRVLKSTCDYIGWIDGDFGPLTESALTSLQRRCELSVTGVVEEKTWYALSKISQ